MAYETKRRCQWRARRIAWCRKYGKFCNAPFEYETCPGYEPIEGHGTAPVERVRRNIRLLRDQILPVETKGWEEVFPETLRLKPLFDLQDRLIEHKFPHEKSAIIDWIISCPGDIYRNMTHGYPDFGYIMEKWERLSSYDARSPLSKLQANDWAEIKEQINDPTYKERRDRYLSNLQRLREETLKMPMDPKRSAVMVESLDMIKALIFWFESLDPFTPPRQQLDRLTGAIANYFPREFWEGSSRVVSRVVEEAERRLRGYGYKLVSINIIDEVLPEWRMMLEEFKTFEEKVNYVVHEAIEIEEVYRRIGRWMEPRLAGERGLVNLMEIHLIADRYAPSSPRAFMYNITMQPTLELKSKHGSELKQMIAEAEREKREVGTMLCRSPSGNVHLSRTCYGRRETVTVTDCHDGLSPLGSFHVHLGTEVFSPADLELALRKEELSCLGYTRGDHSYLKCIMPKRYYEYGPEKKAEIQSGLVEAKRDIEQATQLFRGDIPKAVALSQRAKSTLSNIEQLLGTYEVEL